MCDKLQLKEKSFRQFFFHDAKIGLAIFDILNHCIMIVYGSITKLVNYTSLICIHTKKLVKQLLFALNFKKIVKDGILQVLTIHKISFGHVKSDWTF